MSVETELLALLDYQRVLSAVASTHDGLVVSSVGIDTDDAEAVAAAGSAVIIQMGENGEARPMVELEDGSLHVGLGQELMLVVVAERDAPAEPLAAVMEEALMRLDASIQSGNFEA